MKHVFRKNATVRTILKTNFSKSMAYLANSNESIDVDPIHVAMFLSLDIGIGVRAAKSNEKYK